MSLSSVSLSERRALRAGVGAPLAKPWRAGLLLLGEREDVVRGELAGHVGVGFDDVRLDVGDEAVRCVVAGGPAAVAGVDVGHRSVPLSRSGWRGGSWSVGAVGGSLGRR